MNQRLAVKDHDVIDPDLNLDRTDYKNPYTPKFEDKEKVEASLEPPVPDLAEVLAAPRPPKLGETKLVSIAVTDDVPLKDVFVELARMADVDIEVDAGITGGVSFRAKDRPFNEVIERLTDLAGLRYTTKQGVLRIERDTPYVQDYPINFLSIDRNANGSFNVSSTGAGSASSGTGSGSTGTGTGAATSTGSTGSAGSTGTSGTSGTNSAGSTSGSSSNVNSKADADFWKQFEAGVKQILVYNPGKRVSDTGAGAPDAAAASAAAQAANSADANKNSFYIINRQASTLTVSATDKQHEMIKQFLRIIDANTSSQVLIEAKVLEVTLNDSYQTGINWKNFGGKQLNFNSNLSDVTPTNTGITAPTLTVFKNNVIGSLDLSAAVSLLEEFGTTRALSSPRLNAMNNQRAVLSFAEGLVYFNVKVTTTDALLNNSTVVTPGKVDVSSTQNTVPIGIVLSLQPAIDSKTNEVTLDIHPTLTRLTKYINDPGFDVSKANAIAQLIAAGGGSASTTVINSLNSIVSQVPQIETREMDSIVKVKSGQALVIGGLLEDNVTNNDAGVPVADEVPLWGNLFKSVSKVNSKKELVIFLRATIVPPSGATDKADKALYDKFGNDPRPLNFSQ